MNKTREFDNILDECLERLLVNGETLEQCLTSFPQQAGELRPLLEVALATKKAVAIQPRSEFREQARQQLYAAMPATKFRRSRSLFVWRWQPSWATVTAIVLALLLTGSGTVFAASSSMPDQPLYPVKLATEQVKLTLTHSALDKAELYAELADRRVQEMARMADENKPEEIEPAARRMGNYLGHIAELASIRRVEDNVVVSPQVEGVPPVPRPGMEGAPPMPKPGAEGVAMTPRTEGGPPMPKPDMRGNPDHQARLRATVAQYARNHPERLRGLLKTAPQSARPALRRAIDLSEAGYEKVLQSFD